MVSTISSAPPESASSLANIAPNAIRMPTPAAVVPNPSAKESNTSARLLPSLRNDAHGDGAEDQREEWVQFGDGDQHDDERNTGQRRHDQLPSGCDGLSQLGVGRQYGDGGVHRFSCSVARESI